MWVGLICHRVECRVRSAPPWTSPAGCLAPKMHAHLVDWCVYAQISGTESLSELNRVGVGSVSYFTLYPRNGEVAANLILVQGTVTTMDSVHRSISD
jgi:hypothetical protein